VSTVGVDERLTDRHVGEPTLASTWEAIAGGRFRALYDLRLARSPALCPPRATTRFSSSAAGH